MVRRFNDNPFCIATRGGTISAHSKKGFYVTNKHLRMTVMDDSAILSMTGIGKLKSISECLQGVETGQ